MSAGVTHGQVGGQVGGSGGRVKMTTHERRPSPTFDIDAYWRDLVTAALLGTDRREPPAPPPGLIADLVDDAVRPDDASRMLAAVGAVAATRRAGFVPGPAAGLLQPPGVDHRRPCSPDAVATWREIVVEWPVLEDEWVLTVIEQGLRLSPEVVIDLLVRHRRDVVRRARVALAAGPIAAWLSEHVPDLDAATDSSAAADAVATVPDLPVPPDLVELLTADAHTFAQTMVAGFDDHVFGAAHRAVLVNVLARCRPAVLLDAAAALERTRVGLALALADLARLRHRMLTDLGAPV